MAENIFAAVCASGADDGLYRYSFDAKSGRLELLDKTFAPQPLYTAVNGGFIYTVMFHPFAKSGDSNSAVGRYKIQSDGSLEKSGEFKSTFGLEGCHVSVGGGRIFAANYGSGSAATLDLEAFERNCSVKLSQHTGSGVDPERQSMPHVHQTIVTPDGNYVCAVDLGIDAVVVYDFDLCEISRTSLPAGTGPRHIAFSPDGMKAYCLTEMGSTVEVLDYTDGAFIHTAQYSTLPDSFGGHNQSAAIRVSSDGSHVYASNRGHDSIAHFTVIAGGALELAEVVPTGGCWPRDINFSPDGRWMYACNERSNTITFFKVNADGNLKYSGTTAAAPAPIAIEFYKA